MLGLFKTWWKNCSLIFFFHPTKCFVIQGIRNFLFWWPGSYGICPVPGCPGFSPKLPEEMFSYSVLTTVQDVSLSAEKWISYPETGVDSWNSKQFTLCPPSHIKREISSSKLLNQTYYFTYENPHAVFKNRCGWSWYTHSVVTHWLNDFLIKSSFFMFKVKTRKPLNLNAPPPNFFFTG